MAKWPTILAKRRKPRRITEGLCRSKLSSRNITWITKLSPYVVLHILIAIFLKSKEGGEINFDNVLT